MAIPLEEPPWHATYIAPESDSVPDLINNTTDLVRDLLTRNVDWATDAIGRYEALQDKLLAADPPEELPAPPHLPPITTTFNATLGPLGNSNTPSLGDITTSDPLPLVLDTIEVPDVTASLPNYQSLGLSISIPDAPNLGAVPIPGAPSITTTYTLPAAPVDPNEPAPALITPDLPAVPDIVLPTFTDAAPEFTAAVPNNVINWTEPVYASGVKDAVAAVLLSMLAGGTGLPPDVENAIWQRAREREDVNAAKAVDTASAAWVTKGWEMPPGMLNAQLLDELDKAARKINELSREVMVKQAELEQENRKIALQYGVSYEQVFVGLFIQFADRNFQIAKFAVESALQIFQAEAALFDIKQKIFAQKTERVRLLLEMALTQLKVVHERLEVEKQKGELNQQTIQLYITKRQAVLTAVELYKGQIAGLQALTELDKNRVDVFRGQVEGAVAQVNQNRAAFDAYTARVTAEGKKADLEEANARAYAAQVQGVAAKAEIVLKGADAKIQNNRLLLEANNNQIARLNTMAQLQLSRVQAQGAAYNVTTQRDMAKFQAEKESKNVELQTQIAASQVSLSYYNASVEVWKSRTQNVLQWWTIQQEALRTMAQVTATFAAGAMAGTHVSAGISAGASASQGKSDSSQRSTSFSQQVQDSAGYQVNHNFNHEV